MYEETWTETVGEDGMVHLALPELEPGQRVEVTVRDETGKKNGQPAPIRREPDEFGRYRTAGGLEGMIWIAPDFDDPIPEMEPYS